MISPMLANGLFARPQAAAQPVDICAARETFSRITQGMERSDPLQTNLSAAPASAAARATSA